MLYQNDPIWSLLSYRKELVSDGDTSFKKNQDVTIVNLPEYSGSNF